MDQNSSDANLADVDFEIILHFGNFYCIDLLRRGIYSIRAVLSVADEIIRQDDSSVSKGTGNGKGSGSKFNFSETNSASASEVVPLQPGAGTAMQSILPVGCFSAPDSLDVYVKGVHLDGPLMLYNSYIEEADRSFRSRTCIVRFKEEVHELNDGVHFRFTIPNVDVSSLCDSNQSPSLTQTLILTFDLLCCEFITTNDKGEKIDLLTNLEVAIPENRIFNSVATQSIGINRASSGLHEYFPVNFSRDNFAKLDVMVHCAVTSIRYNKVVVPSLLVKALANSFDLDDSDSADSESSGDEKDEKDYRGQSTILPSSAAIEGGSIGGGFMEHVVLPSDTLAGIALKYDVSIRTIKIANKLSPDNDIDMQALKVIRIPVPQDEASRDSHDDIYTDIDISDDSFDESKITAGQAKADESSIATDVIPKPELNANQVGGGSGSLVRAKDMSPMKKDFISLKPDTASATTTPSRSKPGRRATAVLASPAADTGNLRFQDSLANLLPKALSILNKVQGSNICISLGPPVDSIIKSPLSIHEVDEIDSTSHYNSSQSSHDIEDMHIIPENLNSNNDAKSDISSGPMNPREIAYRMIIKDSINSSVFKACKSYLNVTLLAASRSVFGLDRLTTNFKAGIEDTSKSYLLLREWIANYDVALENFLVNLLVSNNADLDGKPVGLAATLLAKLSDSGRNTRESSCADDSIVDSIVKDLYSVTKGISGDMMALAISSLLESLTSHISSYWSNFYLTIRRNLHSVMSSLINKYNYRHRLFWKRQVIVETCSAASSQFVDEELNGEPRGSILKSLNSSIKSEFENSVSVNGVDKGGRPSVQARGLPLFDVDTHANYHRLPVLHIQQYASNNDSSAVSICRGGSTSYDLPLRLFSDIERSMIKPPFKPKYNHLVVMVSGYRGNSQDLRTLKDIIISELPNVRVLLSAANDEHSLGNDSITTMATRLVRELLDFCRSNHPELMKPKSINGNQKEKLSTFKISFVGHSMGGLIIRKALEDDALKVLGSNLFLYLSLSSPHLGSLYADSALISTSMWAIHKWTNNVSLKELVMEDIDETKFNVNSLADTFKDGIASIFKSFNSSSSTSTASSSTSSVSSDISPSSDTNGLLSALQSSLVYQMSKKNTLSKFQKVILATTIDDAYVPRYSAIIRPLNSADFLGRPGSGRGGGAAGPGDRDQVLKSVIADMGQSILSQIDPSRLLRLQIDNAVDPSSAARVDTMIGRAAHISYLENLSVAMSIFNVIHSLLSSE